MPVTYVNIEWPDKEMDQLYSPSSVVGTYFTSGSSLTVNEFLKTTNKALGEASERVRKKYGYACTSAQSEVVRITEKSKKYSDVNIVKILSIK